MKKNRIIPWTVLAATVFILAAIGLFSLSRRHVVHNNIVHKIDTLIAQKKECVFNLSEVTGFKWDKVAYFKFPATEKQISRELGADYTGGTDLMQGFVFAYQGKVVHDDRVGMDFERPNKLSFRGDDSYYDTNVIVLTEDEAVFKGEKISETGSDSFYIIQVYSGK